MRWLAIWLAACTGQAESPRPPPVEAPMAPSGPSARDARAPAALSLSSPAFEDHGAMPVRFTCEGEDRSPPLAWSAAPPGTKSWALIVDDPDAPDPRAPKRTWVHWVVYDLPVGTTALPEGVGTPEGALDGVNDWKRPGWGGPCPPIGRHRYVHKLYALDVVLGQPGLDKGQLLARMEGHVLAKAELVGTYEKGAP